MKNVFYDAALFNYDKRTKTFTGNSWEIWDMDNKYKHPFPTGKKQFYIKNTKTGGFRRFRFVSEIENIHSADRGIWALIKSIPPGLRIEEIKSLDKVMVFESEDGIGCIIHHKEFELLNK